ncbi:MAG TPA: hypothetical protein VLK22_04595 [Candidatus Udaeobacter sp.]|nr:hypothetical protein [Candidatus Udaeobacter sp.]
MKTNQEKNENDYISELKDWQDHQYTPGYFVGGRIPVWLKYPGKPKLLGLVFLSAGLFGLTIFIYKIIVGTLIQNKEDWFQLPFPLLFIIILILIGIKQF